MSLRPVKRLVKAQPTLEGAGVHLRRAFGFGKTTDFDPFLLLDDFRNGHCLPRRNHCKHALWRAPYSQKFVIEILQVEC